MSHIEAMFNGVKAGDVATVREHILALLNDDTARVRWPEIDRELGSAEIIDLGFEMGDWLFEQGAPRAGAEVYQATFERLRRLGIDVPQLVLAHRLDLMAAQLHAAGQLEAEERALRGSIDLTLSYAERDGLALSARQARLQRLLDAKAKPKKPDVNIEQEAKPTDGLRWEDLADQSFGLDDSELLNIPDAVKKLPGHITRGWSRAPAGDVLIFGAPTASAEPVGTPPPSPPLATGMPDSSARTLEDQLATVPEKGTYTRVPVHFATHREPAETLDGQPIDPYAVFGYVRSAAMNFGRAIVTVPVSRAPGSYKPPVDGWITDNKEPDDVFTIQSIDILSGDTGLFVQDVARSVDRGAGTNRRELLVFVHGYRTSLAHGLMRAAQLAVDIKIQGGVVLYSLPSKAKLLGYDYDRGSATEPAYAEQLADLLEQLSNHAGATRVHLVGHSLGCEILRRALRQMSNSASAPARRRFADIIFAAPDVNHQGFKADLTTIPRLCERVTVYSSKNDVPLMAMSWWTGDPRAGFAAADLAGLSQVDAIDTTGASQWWQSPWNDWGHWDFADEAIDDIRAVVWLSLLPEGRRRLLAPVRISDGLSYWSVVSAGPTVALFRKALTWARELQLISALETAQRAVVAERQLQPPGDRLQEYEGLVVELEHFTRSRRGAGQV